MIRNEDIRHILIEHDYDYWSLAETVIRLGEKLKKVEKERVK